jgi:DNA-directed RNA polymerase subunit M/transcription elongation factor TFIIS
MFNEQEHKELIIKGKMALSKVIKIQKNIDIIESVIFKNAIKSESYKSVYLNLIYQAVGDFISGIKLKEIINSINKNKNHWDHYSFEKIRNKINEHDEFIINPFEVEEGVTTCKCGSKRVFTYQKQTRGADEPMTTFAKCVKCNAQWTYSG